VAQYKGDDGVGVVGYSEASHTRTRDVSRNVEWGCEGVGSRPLPLGSPPLHVPSVSLPLPSLPLPSPFLEVGPLNPARESGVVGERCKLPAGSGAELQPELNMAYFSFKI